MKRKKAFTLVELLVVITILSVLSALIFSGLRYGLRTADRIKASSQMREIGLAVFAYANENNDRVPGPLLAGASSEYNPNKTTELATFLGPYLEVQDLSKKQVLPVFLPPACVQAVPGVPSNAIRPYVINISMVVNGRATSPWGSDTKGPERLGAVSKTTWAFVDADQENPQVVGQPWAKYTPAGPVHGRKRLGWFFNGSVQSVEHSALVDAKAPPPRR